MIKSKKKCNLKKNDHSQNEQMKESEKRMFLAFLGKTTLMKRIKNF